MPIELSGLYVYTIQGLMQAQSVDNQEYIVALRESAANPDGNLPLEVNQANVELKTDAQNPDPGAVRPAFEMPILTGFYSLNYPVPPKPPPTRIPHNPNFSPSGFPEGFQSPVLPPRTETTPDIGYAYTPNSGYYPFSESGFMIFTPDDAPEFSFFVPQKGSISGRCRVNTAGYPPRRAGRFTGRYVFDVNRENNIISFDPTGVITIQFNGFRSHVWDYAFAVVSSEELFVAANARVPRPGVATGTMKKIRL